VVLGMKDNDTAVFWTYERMIQKTLPYCIWLDLGWTRGWCSSVEAVDDWLEYRCPN
jgi:hypothetical protein